MDNAVSFPAVKTFARLGSPAREILEGYLQIRDASLATVSSETRSSNPIVSYFAIRRADRDKILGPDHIRQLLKSSDPLPRAAAVSAAPAVLGPKSTEVLIQTLKDTNPAVVESAIDAMSDATARTEICKALLDALPKLPVRARHKAIRIFGKFKYRPAVDPLDDLFRRRDNTDSPAACLALAAIQGRAFLDGITEFLYPDNPLELQVAILECMAENPAPVYFSKTTQLLKTLRNKTAVAEVVRRIALWSPQGVDFAITLLGNSDTTLADAAQEGIVRHLRVSGQLPPGFLQKLAKTSLERDAGAGSAASQIKLPAPLDALETKLYQILSTKPDPEYQQLLFLSHTSEKHFMNPRLIQLAAARWGDEPAKVVEQFLGLGKDEATLVRTCLQSRWSAQSEQHSFAMTIARMIDSVGQAKLHAPVKEISRHLDTQSLPIQMATVSALAEIGTAVEAAEIEKRVAAAHWTLKRRMVYALAKLVPENPTAGLFKLCEDAEPLVRISAVRAMETVRHEKAYNILLQALEDKDERVRSAACSGLRGFAGRKEAETRLYEMLKDTDARVRANTVESLESVLSHAPAELRFRLKPVLSDPNARVVINTAKAIFPVEPDLAFPVIDSYLKAPDSNLRAGALWALGHLRRPDTFLTLHFHGLREKDPYVQSFINKGNALMEEHPFYKDARYLLLSTKLTQS